MWYNTIQVQYGTTHYNTISTYAKNKTHIYWNMSRTQDKMIRIQTSIHMFKDNGGYTYIYIYIYIHF